MSEETRQLMPDSEMIKAYLSELTIQWEKVKEGTLEANKFWKFAEEAKNAGVPEEYIKTITAPEKTSQKIETAEDLRQLTIMIPSSEQISNISIENTAELMRKFCGLSFMLPHLDKYGETPEAQKELSSVVTTCLAQIKELNKVREKFETYGNGLDRDMLLKNREKFINYLAKFLQFALPRITKYLLPSSKYKKQSGEKIPASLEALLKSYTEIIK